MQETAKHDATRFIGTTRQDWTLAPRTWLKVDMTGVSDDRVLSDYGDDLYQRSSQRVESNVFLTRSWDTWNLVGDLFFYQDLTTRRPVELNRLPDIRLVGTPQPLHDVPACCGSSRQCRPLRARRRLGRRPRDIHRACRGRSRWTC